MAFTLDVVKQIYGQDVIINNAYHRVEMLEGNKNLITFKICVYSQDKQHLIDTKMHQFVPNIDDNALRWDKQAYEFGKSLDEYSGAVDC